MTESVQLGYDAGSTSGGGGSGTVTNVSTNATLTGGPITTTGTLGIATSAAIPGSPTTTTQTAGDNSTKISTTAFVTTAISNAIAGVNPAVAVQAATTSAANTSALTYSNGVAGIGATLTGAINTALTVDDYTFTALGQRLLVKNDTQSPSGAFNGVYYVTQVQTSLLPLILTRSLDYDQPSDINNTGAIPVINGTVNALTSWIITSTVNTIGTDALTYAQFSLAPPSSNSLIRSVGVGADNSGSVLSTGSIGFVTVPYSCTITKWYLAADQSGSIVIDVKRSGTSIVGAGNKPTLTSAQSGNATVSGWTSVSLSAGDILEFNINSATTITRVNLVLSANVL